MKGNFMMNLGEYLRSVDNEEMAAFLVMFMLTTIKAVGFEPGGFDIDLERESVLKLLTEPLTDNLKEAIQTYKSTSKFIS